MKLQVLAYEFVNYNMTDNYGELFVYQDQFMPLWWEKIEGWKEEQLWNAMI